MRKNLQHSLLTTLMMAVLCAGTVSASQLSLTVQTTTCRGFCSKKLRCPNVLGCACVMQPGFTTGTCQLIAARPGR